MNGQNNSKKFLKKKQKYNLTYNNGKYLFLDKDNVAISLEMEIGEIRNYETILHMESKGCTFYCAECGEKLSIKNVKFKVNGEKDVDLEVQFCEKCDDIPPDSSWMKVEIDTNLAIGG